MKETRICVIGLGYVGLPLARLFSTKYPTVGFDMSQARVDALMAGHDSTLEVADDLADGGAGTNERREVGVVVAVHGGGDGHHIEVAVFYIFNIVGATESVLVYSFLKEAIVNLKGTVVPLH